MILSRAEQIRIFGTPEIRTNAQVAARLVVFGVPQWEPTEIRPLPARWYAQACATSNSRGSSGGYAYAGRREVLWVWDPADPERRWLAVALVRARESEEPGALYLEDGWILAEGSSPFCAPPGEASRREEWRRARFAAEDAASRLPVPAPLPPGEAVPLCLCRMAPKASGKALCLWCLS